MPATAQSKSTDPRDRMGVFKRLDDVPTRRRLHQHAAAYEGRDVWAEFINANGDRYKTEDTRQRVERAGEVWKDHMDGRGRHYALATPADVEAWASWMVDEYTVGYAYNGYWVRVDAFYEWLRWHTDHPHVYQPVRMAAADPDAPASRAIWDEKVGRRRDRE
ncbi:hypothetical protein [Halococcus saccharolyticus]|uniref:Uncharacterized protein n=1 Tax=Halococcus saccharolyticus DSM 5350 TaxID=1227455 RepID=M0MEV4_9EURY|nr:hypothetical protein [Halococcus saccharolyticus]EMA44282.1 hypothetical protein C449_12168 [Halococcus saccharolyticus DSM 5350]